MEKRTNKRSLRVALVLGAALAGTALVGWGGLAAWQAYSDNAGNSVSAGTLSHTNNGCSSSTTLTAATGTAKCAAVITVSNADYNWTGQSGTVTIVNSGSLTSTFSMQLANGPTASPSASGICSDLQLSVAGSKGYYYYGSATTPAPLGSVGTVAVDSAGNGGTTTATWATNATNTFTFDVTPTSAWSTDSTIAGASCTFDILWTQQG